eukprot:TRINITY_DN4668_c0_g1_i1.p2 TRINITY_DN4668_c0_g1~~TRINITY_DN4668_c0_g1_i1.p2  ORF type:complete len:166 (-),score=76.75 TRINITY_DN4668_c0_g1_i1:467-964(-)
MGRAAQVRAFVRQRQAEVAGPGASAALLVQQAAHSQAQARPSSSALSLLQAPASDVSAWLDATDAAVGALHHPRLRLLLELRSSRRCVDRLVAALQQLLLGADKSLDAAAAAERKRNELERLVQATQTELEQLMARSQQLQQRLEAWLSRQYDGRPVQLVGMIGF